MSAQDFRRRRTQPAAAAVCLFVSAFFVRGAGGAGPLFSGSKTVISRQDILMSGFATAADLVVNRTEFNSFGVRKASASGTWIVLINGERSSVGLSTVPVAAVERIEICEGALTGTTSSSPTGG